MKLVIAEKPSVAQSLAKVIGANQKKEQEHVCDQSFHNDFILAGNQHRRIN